MGDEHFEYEDMWEWTEERGWVQLYLDWGPLEIPAREACGYAHVYHEMPRRRFVYRAFIYHAHPQWGKGYWELVCQQSTVPGVPDHG